MKPNNQLLRFLSFFGLFLTVLCTPLLAARQDTANRPQVYDNPDSLLCHVVEAINRNQFATADQIINAQLQQDGDSLKWCFLRGMRHYGDLFAAAHPIDKTALEALAFNLSRVAAIADERLSINPNDSLGLFYGGGAYGYLGIAYASDGSMFKAVSTAKKGAKYHERLISLHADCYDAYLGPGLMNLMTSAAPWILKPILFLLGLSGTEDKADEYLSLAYAKGTRVRYEAGQYLAQLRLRQKDYPKAFELYSNLTTEYPMRVGLRAEYLSSLFSDKRHDDIIKITSETMDSFEASRYSFSRNDSAWIPYIFWDCAQAFQLTGNPRAAIQTWKRFLGGKPYDSQSKWRAYDSLIDLYLSIKDTALAIESFEALNASDAPPKVKDRARERIAVLPQAQNHPAP